MLISYRGSLGERDRGKHKAETSPNRSCGRKESFTLSLTQPKRQKAHSPGADTGRKQFAASRPPSDARPDVGGVMLRVDCLHSVYSELKQCLVVTIMGAVAAELQSLGHHPNFFESSEEFMGKLWLR
jgi:hypothetical protein